MPNDRFRPIAVISRCCQRLDLMALRLVHKVARMATIGLTVAGAAFGSVAGLAGSGWGGVFVIVPLTTALFAIVGALLGAVIEFAIRLKHPTNYEL